MTTTDEPPVTRATYLKLALLSAGLFLTGTNAFVIAGLLPTLAEAFGTTRATVGYSITVYALVIAVAAPAASILLGHISRTTLIVSGLAVMAIGILITAMAPTIEVFIVGRAIGALGGAVLVPTSTAAGPALLPPKRVATAIAVSDSASRPPSAPQQAPPSQQHTDGAPRCSPSPSSRSCSPSRSPSSSVTSLSPLLPPSGRD
jgi:DHA1 family inner membrane transport protein